MCGEFEYDASSSSLSLHVWVGDLPLHNKLRRNACLWRSSLEEADWREGTPLTWTPVESKCSISFSSSLNCQALWCHISDTLLYSLQFTSVWRQSMIGPVGLLSPDWRTGSQLPLTRNVSSGSPELKEMSPEGTHHSIGVITLTGDSKPCSVL